MKTEFKRMNLKEFKRRKQTGHLNLTDIHIMGVPKELEKKEDKKII